MQAIHDFESRTNRWLSDGSLDDRGCDIVNVLDVGVPAAGVAVSKHDVARAGGVSRGRDEMRGNEIGTSSRSVTFDHNTNSAHVVTDDGRNRGTIRDWCHGISREMVTRDEGVRDSRHDREVVQETCNAKEHSDEVDRTAETYGRKRKFKSRPCVT